MEINTQSGNYTIIKDYKNGFSKEMFDERYIPEVYDKFKYILGDMSAGILRLKGFTNKTYQTIPDFINETCVYECPYYVLVRNIEKRSDPDGKESKRNPKKG